MKSLISAVEALYPETRRSVRPARSSGLLASTVAVACALTPLLVMVETYIQTA